MGLQTREGDGECWDPGECWEEKAGNCTLTTIKNLSKKKKYCPEQSCCFFGIPMHSFLSDLQLTEELLSYTAHLCSYCTRQYF